LVVVAAAASTALVDSDTRVAVLVVVALFDSCCCACVEGGGGGVDIPKGENVDPSGENTLVLVRPNVTAPTDGVGVKNLGGGDDIICVVVGEKPDCCGERRPGGRLGGSWS
jgi:hypothetical protein